MFQAYIETDLSDKDTGLKQHKLKSTTIIGSQLGIIKYLWHQRLFRNILACKISFRKNNRFNLLKVYYYLQIKDFIHKLLQALSELTSFDQISCITHC